MGEIASITVQREDLFPAGTVVSAYSALGLDPPPVSGPPLRPAEGTGIVATNGILVISGLQAAYEYLLHASSPDRYLRAVADGSPGPNDGITGGGNARVLVWSTDSVTYEPSAWCADTAYPREFVGPTDPSTLSTVAGPVFGDRWTPTEAP